MLLSSSACGSVPLGQDEPLHDAPFIFEHVIDYLVLVWVPLDCGTSVLVVHILDFGPDRTFVSPPLKHVMLTTVGGVNTRQKNAPAAEIYCKIVN